MTAVAGNSIANLSKWGAESTVSWMPTGEIHVANMLAGSPLRFPYLTPTTRSDRCGVYGYSSQTLDTINADIQAQWIDQINGGGVTPQLVIGHALLENDLGSVVSTVSDMQARVQAWIGMVHGAWPGAKILLGTPHPSTYYGASNPVSSYQAMRDYILSLDNGRSIFVARLDGYEDGASPGHPLAGYTDGVHPNAKGAMVNARSIKLALDRIFAATITPYALSELGSDLTLAGSVAATGTSVSGTMPTSESFTGTSANGSFTSLALQPGWRITFNTPTAGANLDLGAFAMKPNGTVSGVTQVSHHAKVRIVSGAANLRWLALEPRVSDGGGANLFQYYIPIRSTDADPDFQDGDVLTLVVPPLVAGSGTITGVRHQIRPTCKNTTGSVVIEIIEAGYYKVA